MATGPMIDTQLIGRGLMFNTTDDVQYVNYVDWQVGCEVEVLRVAVGDQVRDQIIEIRQIFDGHVTFRELNADSMAQLTGGAAAVGSVGWVERESIVSATAKITVGTAMVYDDAVQVYNITNGTRCRIVPGVPSESGEVQPSGGTSTEIISHADDNGDTFEVSYYATLAGGETVTVDTTDLPSSFALVLSVRAYDKPGAAYLTDGHHIELDTCKRKGRTELATTVAEMATMGFDFECEGEVRYRFPST
ncbi:MAG: hypothetical protein V3W37_03180 [Candidatus Binatia bacterium]